MRFRLGKRVLVHATIGHHLHPLKASLIAAAQAGAPTTSTQQDHQMARPVLHMNYGVSKQVIVVVLPSQDSDAVTR
jgi:hypothetical protein